jgi:hypothetical protein
VALAEALGKLLIEPFFSGDRSTTRYYYLNGPGRCGQTEWTCWLEQVVTALQIAALFLNLFSNKI